MPLAELAALQVVGVDAEARVERALDATVHELDGGLDVRRRHALGPRQSRRQLAVEALERDVGDRASHPRVDRLVDPTGSQVALDEPGGGAPRHPLEIRDPEGLAAREQRERARMADGGRSREGPARTAELALPAVRVRERIRLARIVGSEACERSQPLTLGRRRLDRPREPRERRRVVCRRTSSASKSSHTASQNGLGSRGEPSSVAASRTSVSRRRGRVQAV